jgi:hypothetical protein
MMVERVEITEKIGKIWTEEGWNGMDGGLRGGHEEAQLL